MSRLYLVRHGPTHAKTFVGWTDLPADLSDKAQIARLAEALPDTPIVSSDLDRAIKTADAVQQSRPRLPHAPALRETYFGEWEGLGWSEIEKRDAALARRVFETPGDSAPPGGESWNAFSARVSEAIDSFDRDIVIVAHMGVILTQLQRALGCSAYDALSHQIDPLSLTILERRPNWRALSINQTF